MPALDKKITRHILIYCFILYACNWTYKVETESYSMQVDTVAGITVCNIIFLIALIWKSWLLIRELLDNAVHVPRSVKLSGSFMYLFLLIPLGIKYRKIFEFTETVKKDFYYGGEIDNYLILIAAFTIMFMQLNIKLKSFLNDDYFLNNKKTAKN